MPKDRARTHAARSFFVLVLAAAVAGCTPATGVAIVSSSAGVATGAGIEHSIGGKSYKTFVAPLGDVESAVRSTLARMTIDVEESEDTDDGRIIKGRAENRRIEIGFERLTPTTTRMSVVANRLGAFFRDGSTATEIIMQTAKVLEDGQEPATRRGSQTASEMGD